MTPYPANISSLVSHLERPGNAPEANQTDKVTDIDMLKACKADTLVREWGPAHPMDLIGSTAVRLPDHGMSHCALFVMQVGMSASSCSGIHR